MTSEAEPPRRGRRSRVPDENSRLWNESLYVGGRPDEVSFPKIETGLKENGECTHRWLCGPPVGDVVYGVCKHCGENKSFIQQPDHFSLGKGKEKSAPEEEL